MIHNLHTLSIKRYAKMQESGDLSLLKRWFNPFPVGWFNTNRFFEDYRVAFDVNVNLDKDRHNLLTYNNILALEKVYQVLLVIFKAQNQKTLFNFLMNKKPVVIKSHKDFYIRFVKKQTGINIKDGNDLKKLHKEIKRRTDKYRELNQQKEPQKEVDFVELSLSWFTILEQPYNGDLSLYEASKIKKLAEKRAKKLNDGAK